MAAFWGALAGFFTSLPKIIDLLEKLSKWIDDLRDRIAQKKLEDGLQRSGDHAGETKDTSQVEDILRGGHP